MPAFVSAIPGITDLLPNLTCSVEVTLGLKLGGVCASAEAAKKRRVRVEYNIFAKQNLNTQMNKSKNRKRFAEIEVRRALCKVRSRQVGTFGRAWESR